MNKMLKQLLFLSTMSSMLACGTIKPRVTTKQLAEIDSLLQKVEATNRAISDAEMRMTHAESVKKVNQKQGQLSLIALELYKAVNGDSLEKTIPTITPIIPDSNTTPPYDKIVVLTGVDNPKSPALSIIKATKRYQAIEAMWHNLYDMDNSLIVNLGNPTNGFDMLQLDSLSNNISSNITNRKNDAVSATLIHLSQHGNVWPMKDTLTNNEENWHVSEIKNENVVKTVDIVLGVTKNILGPVDIILDNCKGSKVCKDTKNLTTKTNKGILPNGSVILALADSVNNNNSAISSEFLNNILFQTSAYPPHQFLVANLLHHLANMQNKDFKTQMNIDTLTKTSKAYRAQLGLAIFNNNQCQTFDLNAVQYSQAFLARELDKRTFNDLKTNTINFISNYQTELSKDPINKFLETIKATTLENLEFEALRMENAPDIDKKGNSMAIFLVLQGVENGMFDALQNAKNQAYGIKPTPTQTNSRLPAPKK